MLYEYLRVALIKRLYEFQLTSCGVNQILNIRRHIRHLKIKVLTSVYGKKKKKAMYRVLELF